jgi:DNA-binding transcriptional ArsR family regulator
MARGGSMGEPDDDGLFHPGRYEWERVLRRCVLPAPVKTTGAYAAQYANRDGTRVYPGVARLAAVTGLSERSVRGALQTLRELRLLTRTRKGSSLGRQALTDEHELTIPVGLHLLVHLLDPEESPASAACDPTCEHPASPARPAGDRPSKTAAATQEHRHLLPGTPAPGARTPAPHDRNTGRRCTPPNHDHSKDQPTDQRGDPVDDTELLTARARAGPHTSSASNVVPFNRRGGAA